MTPDVKSSVRAQENGGGDSAQLSPDPGNKSDLLDDEEDFFDFISRQHQIRFVCRVKC